MLEDEDLNVILKINRYNTAERSKIVFFSKVLKILKSELKIQI